MSFQLTQRVTSQPSAAASVASLEAEPLNVKIKVQLAGTAEHVSDDENPEIVLVPGESYTLCVRIRHTATGDGFLLEDPITFDVTWPGTGLDIQMKRRTVEASDFIDRQEQLLQTELRVESDCAIQAGELKVWYKTDWDPRQLVRTLHLRLDGRYHQATPEFQQKSRVRLDEAGPQNQAIVVIEPAGADQLRITGFHAELGGLAGHEVQQPSHSLADLDDEPTSLAILNGVRGFSRSGVPWLLKWLNDVLEAVENRGEELSIIFVEYVETKVPWEMVEVREGRPVGAKAVVVRWLPVTFHSLEKELEPSLVVRQGRILAYLDHESATDERRALGRCVWEACATIDELRQRLSGMQADFGLVFLACHGIFARDPQHAVQVASFNNPRDRIRPLDLEAPPSLPPPRPIAFLNACHSGRVIRDGGKLIGLPEVFLAKFADGFLGTLGPVEEGIASAFAGRFLDSVRSSQDGSNVPEFLRQLRAEVTGQLEWNDPVSRRRYVNTFMYVFYGSPETSLQLDEAAPGGSGP